MAIVTGQVRMKAEVNTINIDPNLARTMPQKKVEKKKGRKIKESKGEKVGFGTASMASRAL